MQLRNGQLPEVVRCPLCRQEIASTVIDQHVAEVQLRIPQNPQNLLDVLEDPNLTPQEKFNQIQIIFNETSDDEIRIAMLTARNEHGCRPLHLAIPFENIVRLLINAAPNEQILNIMLIEQEEDGAIPLHSAVSGPIENTAATHLLINATTNNNIRYQMLTTHDSDGDTPLHNAVIWNHIHIVRTLINGALNNQMRHEMLTARNNLEETPLDMAISNEEWDRDEMRNLLQEALDALPQEE